MNSVDRVANAHEALGRFVVIFQWIENQYRQIGWFILDPERKNWPPTSLRRESNHQLLEKVTDSFVQLTQTYALPGGDEKAEEILNLKPHFHELRRYRNRLMHSTYVELKAGGEVHGYLRSNPEVGVDPDTGELIYDQEDFSADVIDAKVREYGDRIFRLNLLYTQLIHWAPFERQGLHKDGRSEQGY